MTSTIGDMTTVIDGTGGISNVRRPAAHPTVGAGLSGRSPSPPGTTLATQLTREKRPSDATHAPDPQERVWDGLGGVCVSSASSGRLDVVGRACVREIAGVHAIPRRGLCQNVRT